LSVRQAAFIGVGAMVGAGIFALLGAAGEVAGAAVWLSFLIAGVVAGLQGYSFAKFGARYPSAAGLFEYLSRGFGDGHLTGVTAWLTYVTNAIVTAMVAVSFGSYASALFTDGNPTWAKVFAALILVIMTGVNVVGSQLVAKAQIVIVYIVLGILVVSAVVTLATANATLLAPSGYPPLRDILASVALTFFAFLGFGIITFTAKDLREPSRQLPRAMLLALSIATGGRPAGLRDVHRRPLPGPGRDRRPPVPAHPRRRHRRDRPHRVPARPPHQRPHIHGRHARDRSPRRHPGPRLETRPLDPGPAVGSNGHRGAPHG
jgi:amino acid transporter